MSAPWIDLLATVALLLLVGGYLIRFRLAQRRGADDAPSAHARLREDWFLAIDEQPGSEVLAVQTLRNSLMSATATASTALLALLGTVSLVAPSLRGGLAVPPSPAAVTPMLVIELLLVVLMLASLVASTMAVRDYHHASFVGGMPVESAARRRWAAVGRLSVRRAGLLYGWGLRLLMLVAPVAVAALAPVAGTVAAAFVVAALRRFDHIPTT